MGNLGNSWLKSIGFILLLVLLDGCGGNQPLNLSRNKDSNSSNSQKVSFFEKTWPQLENEAEAGILIGANDIHSALNSRSPQKCEIVSLPVFFQFSEPGDLLIRCRNFTEEVVLQNKRITDPQSPLQLNEIGVGLRCMWTISQADDDSETIPSCFTTEGGPGAPAPDTSPTPSPTPTPTPPPNGAPNLGMNANCVLIIGFSQTRQWSEWINRDNLKNGLFQHLTINGAGINRWKDPNYSGWRQPAQSACGQNSSNPDVVIFTVSADNFENKPDYNSPAFWEKEAQQAIPTVISKVTSVKTIYLQPVVGADSNTQNLSGGTCRKSNQVVRAAANFNNIVTGLADYATKNPTVNNVQIKMGFKPTVQSCNHYSDGLGHLTSTGSENVSGKITDYYY